MEHSTLGQLPAELRNEIYKLVLTTNEKLSICSSAVHGGCQRKPGATQPPITKACKQTRNESLQMFYHLNTFIINISGAPRGNLKQRKDFLHQKSEVARWSWCTDERNHRAISKLKLVIYMPWETGRLARDWSSFIQVFERHRYQMPKLQISVHILSHFGLVELLLGESAFDKFRKRQTQKAKDFFDGMGLKVKVKVDFKCV